MSQVQTMSKYVIMFQNVIFSQTDMWYFISAKVFAHCYFYISASIQKGPKGIGNGNGQKLCNVLSMEGVTVGGHHPECHVTFGRGGPHIVW